MTDKEKVLDLVQRLPDDISMEGILYELDVFQAIEESIRQLDAGQGIPHEQVVKEMAQWLKSPGPLTPEPLCEKPLSSSP